MSERSDLVDQYRNKIRECRQVEADVQKHLQDRKDLVKEYDRSEEDVKAIQSVGMLIGDVLKQMTEERFIVKASSGPRYVVGCRNMTTLTIMRPMPREVDPTAPKGVLLYGPPGTGKTLLARALASNINGTFLKVVASAIMFGYAKDHQPCVIFMDEIQRTLMELLNQLDGFESLGAVKIVMATNRPDILDPALLRPGRLDRKIEIPLPNEAVVKLADGFNGADLRNICTEAGLFAIRDERDYILEEDMMKAARKIAEAKKLESKLDYSQV
eukprot:GSChrysophyteH1.ASY1.ANO1.874.1 assembled CDS